jgi:hypothetical protein
VAHRDCEFYGHYWGNGPASSVLVCCRERCTAQAVCLVCVSGCVPHGFLVASCPAHVPPPAPVGVERRQGNQSVSLESVSLWSEGETDGLFGWLS